MRIVFLDEAGYAPNWENSISAQPYFVFSAICLPADTLSATYDDVRMRFAGINLTGLQVGVLGKGFEIKAKDIAHGGGYWKSHNSERNAIRDLMLDAPKRYGGTAFLVVVDKQAHLNQYSDPTDPYLMSVQFLFERLQAYLKEVNDYAVCFFDKNAIMEFPLASHTTELTRDGSFVVYEGVIKRNNIDRVVELGFGHSENSVGLQVADFFASMTYAYVGGGKPSPCGWWALLEQSLYRYNGKLSGWGYKQFP